MSGLEQIVRPFQRPNTLATRRIIASSTKVEVPEAIISWGAAGTLPGATEIPEIVTGGFKVIVCADKIEEKERETTPVKIEQVIRPSVCNRGATCRVDSPPQPKKGTVSSAAPMVCSSCGATVETNPDNFIVYLRTDRLKMDKKKKDAKKITFHQQIITDPETDQKYQIWVPDPRDPCEQDYEFDKSQ